ncbi:TPA: hypothetical protein REW71_001677 [Klebsiella pneumoniae]|nr:hypothetical protein [Klebsiella pneumoniae]
MNHITHGFALGLQAINDRIPAYHYPVRYKANYRPTHFASNKRCAVFQ